MQLTGAVTTVALAFGRHGLRVFPAVLRQRAADVHNVVEAALLAASDVPLVAAGVDQFRFSRAFEYPLASCWGRSRQTERLRLSGGMLVTGRSREPMLPATPDPHVCPAMWISCRRPRT